MVCYRQIITYILHGVCKRCGEVDLIGLYSYVDLYKGNPVLVLQENKSEGYTVNVTVLDLYLWECYDLWNNPDGLYSITTF
jgi:hypothetical protein